MSNIKVFENSNFGTVRTVGQDNQVWFVAVDICNALDIKNTSQAVAKLDDDERSMFNIGRQGETNCVNEMGLYNLILRSDKPQAKQFKRWITHEVLPSIRKTGAYHAPGYQTKATSVGEVVNLINITRQSMKDQGCNPREIAIAMKGICEQFNIPLPDCFIKPKETTLKDVMDMIDFIYSRPKGRRPTYEEFIVHASIQKIGGFKNEFCKQIKAGNE